MKNSLWLVICAMMVSAPAQGQSAPRISGTDVLGKNIRKPDLTISGVSAKPIAAIAYDPDGRFLAVAGGDKAIRLYDARLDGRTNAALSRTLTGHTAPILAIGFNSTNTLVSVSLDQTAKIWDVESGKLLHTAKLNFGKQFVVSVAPRGQPFLAGAAFREVGLWNYQSREQIHSFEVNDSTVSALAFTPDGKSLVIGTFKGVIRVMDLASWKITRMIDLDTPVHSLAASANRVLIGYGDGTVALLNLGDQDSIPELKEQTGAINAVAFSRDTARFASASADKIVNVWDTETMKLLWSLQGHTAAVLSVAFSPDGREMASSDADGNLNYWTILEAPSSPGVRQETNNLLSR